MKLRENRKRRVSHPQTVEFFGNQYLEKPEIQLFKYNKAEFAEDNNYLLKADMAAMESEKVNWLNVHGIHDVDLVRKICSSIGLPRFIVQDILDPSQRPKVQDLDNYIFFTVKSVLPHSQKDIEVEQISFVLGKNTLYSFQEKKGDHFEHVRTRIREDNGLVRKKGADFLLYLLIEGILINFYTTVEGLEQDIKDNINILGVSRTDPSMIRDIELYKQRIQLVRRTLLASRDALQSIEKGDSPLIRPEQKRYYHDLKDNSLQLIESIDTLTGSLDAAENLFFSLQGHRMNQAMTTLTIFAAIFIPLTFLAGIYGMNFDYMPELRSRYGYFVVLGIMLITVVALVIYFKRKRWF